MSQKFRKTKENFTCDHCSCFVTGNGYTNHCPACLWSRHVDIYPGDRAEICAGMMRPVSLEKNGDGYTVIHQCQSCAATTRTKTAAADQIEDYLTAML